VTHIWLDGEVTKIRYVNYRTQFTCAFQEGKMSKVVNEYDAENIEQWIRCYQRKHKVVPPSSPPPPRLPQLPTPAPKPTLASLLIPGEHFPTIQGTCSCSRETIFILNSFFPTYLLFQNPNSNVRFRSRTLRVCPTLLPTPTHTSTRVFTSISNFAYVVGKSTNVTISIQSRRRNWVHVINGCP
jgi:hypothetical protein